MVLTSLLVLVASAILLAIGSMNKDSKVRKNIFMFAWVIGGAGVLLVAVPTLGTQLGIPADFNLGTNQGQVVTQSIVAPTSPGSPVTTTGKCIGVEDTTVTLSAINKYTTAQTGGTHRYRLNGGPALTVSNAGTLTASPGDKISVLWMNGSETPSIYFSAVADEVIACAGTQTLSANLYQNGTMTIEVYSEEANLIDGIATNESLANGDVVTLQAKLKGQYQRGFPYGGVIVAEYPLAVYDDVIVDFGGKLVSRPTFYTQFNGSQTTKTYSVPALLNTDVLQGKVTIDVDDTINPTADGMNNITLTYYPNDYYVDNKNGGIYSGPAVEDEDSTQTKKYSSAKGITAS